MLDDEFVDDECVHAGLRVARSLAAIEDPEQRRQRMVEHQRIAEAGAKDADGAAEPFPVEPADAADPEPRQWLIPGWLPRGRLASIYGRGAIGKSRLLLQIAHDLGEGRLDDLARTVFRSAAQSRKLDRKPWGTALTAEAERTRLAADDEPLHPAPGAGRVDLQVEAVAVAVAAGLGHVSAEGGRQRLVGMTALALGGSGLPGQHSHDSFRLFFRYRSMLNPIPNSISDTGESLWTARADLGSVTLFQ